MRKRLRSTGFHGGWSPSIRPQQGLALFATRPFACAGLAAEALEKWPVEMIERMLPRHLQIIGVSWSEGSAACRVPRDEFSGWKGE